MGKKGGVITPARADSPVFSRLWNPESNNSLARISLSEFDSRLHSMIQKYRLPYEEVLAVLNRTALKSISVPIPIFRYRELTHLGSLIKYLKESEHLSCQQLAAMLQRNQKSVSRIYRKSCQRMSFPFALSEDDLRVPISVFADRSLSTLESLTTYLKDSEKLRFSEIAKIINRDQRTIWTSYQRARQKRL
jgi:hypothetical protein